MPSYLTLTSVNSTVQSGSATASVSLVLSSGVPGATGATGPNSVSSTTTLDYAGLTAASGAWNLVVANAAGSGVSKLDLSATVRSLLGAASASAARTVLGVDAAGTVNYTLPTASGSVLGGIKVGTGLSIDGSGVLSASGGGGGTWGSITGTLSSQTDLQSALTARAVLASANTFTVGGQVIQTAAGTVGLSVDQAASPTVDAFRVRVNGVDRFRVTSAGTIGVPAASSSASFLGGLDLDVSGTPNQTGVQYYSGNIQFYMLNVNRFNLSTLKDFRIPSDHVFGFARATSNNDICDTVLSRVSEGIIGVSDGSGLGAYYLSGADVGFRFFRQDSTTNAQNVGQILASWATSTHATRAGRLTFGAYYTTTLYEGLRVEAVSGGANVSLFGAGSWGGGVGTLFVANATTNPSSNPTGGGILYVDAGALKYRGSSGTVTTLAAA